MERNKQIINSLLYDDTLELTFFGPHRQSRCAKDLKEDLLRFKRKSSRKKENKVLQLQLFISLNRMNCSLHLNDSVDQQWLHMNNPNTDVLFYKSITPH